MHRPSELLQMQVTWIVPCKWWTCGCLSQEQLDVENDEDKYLYDMTDFSGKMKANRNPEFHQQPAPPVPPDREDPGKRTMLFLTIDARTKGE